MFYTQFIPYIFFNSIKMLSTPFNILTNVMVMTVAMSTFVSIIECVPISGGETVPGDGEYQKKKKKTKKPIDRKERESYDFIIRISISDVTFSFAVSIQYREYNETSKLNQYKHFCGGVLLQVYNRTAYVISASHCVGTVYVCNNQRKTESIKLH